MFALAFRLVQILMKPAVSKSLSVVIYNHGSVLISVRGAWLPVGHPAPALVVSCVVARRTAARRTANEPPHSVYFGWGAEYITMAALLPDTLCTHTLRTV